MRNGRDNHPGPDESGLGRALLPVAAVAAILVAFTVLTAELTSNDGGGGFLSVGPSTDGTSTTTTQPRGTFVVQGSTVPGDSSENLDVLGQLEVTEDGDAPTGGTNPDSTEAGNGGAAPGGEAVWVDANAGDNGNGSAEAPFNTISQGVLSVRAGQTLIIKGGTYREQVNPGYEVPKGAADARITMTNAPGERVVIQGRVLLTDADYWTISGINVTWDDANDDSVQHMIIMHGGVDWVWENSEFWGAKAFSAILVSGDPQNFTLRKLYVHDTVPTNDVNQDHLIYCSCGTGGGTIERNLLVGSPNGRGVKVGGPSAGVTQVANVVIRYNTMTGNFGPSSVQLSFETSNITIDRNIMVNAQDYAHNVSTFELNGNENWALNNIGWDSKGVVDPAIGDGTGNIYRDPQLQPGSDYFSYAPADDQSKAYGHLAEG